MSAVFSAQVGLPADAECPVEVPDGASTMRLTSFYGHQVGDAPYSHSSWVFVTGPGIVSASSEGHPIGHIWQADLYPVAECGTTPNSVFSDGFESGDLSAWQ